MNLLLLDTEDLVDETHARVHGRRCTHVRKILKLAVGDSLRVGRVDGPTGEGVITQLDRERLALELRWDAGAALPPASPVTLALAMPRPPTLAKVLQQGTAMGVKRFWLFGARRVEKSYWGASASQPDAMRQDMRLGLEQAKDTVLPTVERFERFRPFVEDHLQTQAASLPVWIADPKASEACPAPSRDARVLVLGPEGGFVDFERELFARCGLPSFTMGPRILRVETAAVALLARLAG